MKSGKKIQKQFGSVNINRMHMHMCFIQKIKSLLVRSHQYVL